MLYKYSCPVPKEQRPINEYSALLQSSFFSWPFLKGRLFQKKIAKIFFFIFLFFSPFSKLFLSNNPSFFNLFLVTLIIASFSILLLLLRLFLAWNYIEGRLYNPTIFYEESGWYDGRLWIKSKNILVQDRFIHAYQVLPKIKKLKNSMLFTFCFLFSCFLALFLN